jgi:hypothetical protein
MVTVYMATDLSIRLADMRGHIMAQNHWTQMALEYFCRCPCSRSLLCNPFVCLQDLNDHCSITP